MEQAEKSTLVRLAPFVYFGALVAIPLAGGVAVLLLLQIPRLFYDWTNPLLPIEVGSLIALPVLVLLLRSCLNLPEAPRGLYRIVLDFLAMRWHPVVIAALIGLLVLPGLWFCRVDRDLVFLFGILGWRAFKVSGDFRDDLDRVATLYQLALMGGLPLLFFLHSFLRWQPQRRVLAWLLLPLLFLATAVSVVVLGTIAHFANN